MSLPYKCENGHEFRMSHGPMLIMGQDNMLKENECLMCRFKLGKKND